MTSSDRASLAPRYTFADTLDEQEAQLRDNPMVRRMAASRKAFEADPHRPLYHFVSPENTLNDPNGLCFWGGRWHLFYQGYPPEDPRPHWGHAVSDDLIHWRDLPYAIYPDPEECCFSGGALAEDDRVIAIYHGTQVGNMVAVSSDPLLLNWEKVTGEPVIPIPDHDGSPRKYTVFDPCIWKKDGVYYSLSGGTLTDGPGGQRIAADFVFRSEDLETWEYLHPLTEDDMFTLVGDDGACPYFWPIGDRHILIFYSHMSGGQYLLGDYDDERDKLVVTSHGLFNFGPSNPSGVPRPLRDARWTGRDHSAIQHEPRVPLRGLEPDHDSAQASHPRRRRRRAGRARRRHRVPATRSPARRSDRAPRQRGGGAGGHQGQRDGAGAGGRSRGRANGRAERPAIAGPGGVHPNRLLQGPRLQGPGPIGPAGCGPPHRPRSPSGASSARGRSTGSRAC